LRCIHKPPAFIDGKIPDPRRLDFSKGLYSAPCSISATIAVSKGLIECGLQYREGPVGRGLSLAIGVNQL
jgi:hypothetical protein